MPRPLRARLTDERGFTLIELLVTIILVGILAAIALAVFLNQQDKGKDASAKSTVNNLVRLVQACSAGHDTSDDFRDCDTPSELGENSLGASNDPPDEISTGDCADPVDSDTVTAPSRVRVLRAGPDCFVVLGLSEGAGNRFWVVRHNGGALSRDCTTRGVHGCPADGRWAG